MSGAPRGPGEPEGPDGSFEEGFKAYCSELTVRFAGIIAWFLAILTPVLWPTDLYFFHDNPEVLDVFGLWRPLITALALVTIVGLRWVPVVRRDPAIYAALIVTAGATVCGVAMGRLGGHGEIFFACGFLIPMATIPLLSPLWLRVCSNFSIALAYSIPYFLIYSDFLHGSRQALSSMVFQLFATVASIIVGHALFSLVRDNYRQRQELGRQAAALADAQEKSEALLLNVLPHTIADKLKDGALTIADAFDDVSVLFVDICGFTGLSAGASAERVVELLNRVFSAFDGLVETAGVEKIKTIGDAYMVASGLPVPREDHAPAIAHLALRMLEVSGGFADPSGEPLRVRIGIHCGPVVAGVIGRKKFIYDLWGDTVNTASRMESHGEPGSIHVSERLAAQLGDEFLCEPRGEIAVKGKGAMRTFFLRGLRSG